MTKKYLTIMLMCFKIVVPPVELVPSHMTFAPYAVEPFSWLHGWALRADGTPGKRVVLAKLYPGITKATVLSGSTTGNRADVGTG